MMETLVALGGMGVSAGIAAGVYYRLGKVEQKLDFLFDHCDITVSFKNNKPHK